MYENRQDPKNAFTKFIVATISGTVATAILYPLTSTHLRYYLTGHYRNPIAEAMARYRVYGITGMYHGGSARVIRDGLSTALRLGIYTSLTDSLFQNKAPFTTGNFASVAVVAGVTSSLIGVPTDFILPKIDNVDYNNWGKRGGRFKRGIRELWKTHGIVGLYRSILSTSVRAAVICVLQFVLYTEIMVAAKRYLPDENPVTVSLICGKIVSRVIRILLTQPFHLLKYRMQLMNMESKKIGLYRFFRIIFHHTLYATMWTGISIYAASQMPFTISFSTLAKIISSLYETWKFHIHRLLRIPLPLPLPESRKPWYKYPFHFPWSETPQPPESSDSPSSLVKIALKILLEKYKYGEKFPRSPDD